MPCDAFKSRGLLLDVPVALTRKRSLLASSAYVCPVAAEFPTAPSGHRGSGGDADPSIRPCLRAPMAEKSRKIPASRGPSPHQCAAASAASCPLRSIVVALDPVRSVCAACASGASQHSYHSASPMALSRIAATCAMLWGSSVVLLKHKRTGRGKSTSAVPGSRASRVDGRVTM